MSLWHLPWLEFTIGLPLIGAIGVGLIREPVRAFRWGLFFTGATLLCALLAWISFGQGGPAQSTWTIQTLMFGRRLFALDELNAPLIVLGALLHFLAALATGRTKMRRYSLSWSLAAEAIRIAMFATREPWLIIGLIALGTAPAYIELRNRRQPTRVYMFHMALFVGLLGFGWAFVDPQAGRQTQTTWATIPLLAAILIRCGVFPFHCWLTDWFECASFGNALLFATPLTGVYVALRLVLPVAPDWVLSSIGIFSLITALYAACMALVQTEARRFFAFIFMSHASLVLVGLELHTATSLTGAIALWWSVALSLTGFGLTLRALEARFGRISLSEFQGLYEHSPMLAICFLLTGLASIGFPGTLGFVATELLVDGAIEASPYIGIVVVMAAALNGIAVLRAYFLLFTGTRHVSSVWLRAGLRERWAVFTLSTLIIGGGFFPQPGIAYCNRAAQSILDERIENNDKALTHLREGP